MLKKTMGEVLSRQKIREERGFRLPLRMWIEGNDALGAAFREEAILSYMSARGASFSMKNFVSVGSRLRLTIDLPPKLAGAANLRLAIRGKVVFVEAPGGPAEDVYVSIRLESEYIIRPENEDAACP
ncbi:MAG: PilZ domain-containing protein [Acidobacteriota bacterium]|nr:PilZ domain-containing protein [Acidobacteriota bacterium]